MSPLGEIAPLADPRSRRESARRQRPGFHPAFVLVVAGKKGPTILLPQALAFYEDSGSKTIKIDAEQMGFDPKPPLRRRLR
jgi:hypothetical protein